MACKLACRNSCRFPEVTSAPFSAAISPRGNDQNSLDIGSATNALGGNREIVPLPQTSLTILTLVTALALSARAGGPLTSALQQHRSASPHHSMFPKLLPAEIYAIDDGTAEEPVGLTLGGDFICLNEFAVVPGGETITSVSIAWGAPSEFDPSLDGLPYLAVLWSDPGGNGDPTDARVLGTAPGVISNQGTDTFLITNLAGTIPTSTFFVGLSSGTS